jgi:hypothetical protein
MILKIDAVLMKSKMSPLTLWLIETKQPSDIALNLFRLRVGLTHNQFCYAANFLKIHETRTLNVSHLHHV